MLTIFDLTKPLRWDCHLWQRIWKRRDYHVGDMRLTRESSWAEEVLESAGEISEN